MGWVVFYGPGLTARSCPGATEWQTNWRGVCIRCGIGKWISHYLLCQDGKFHIRFAHLFTVEYMVHGLKLLIWLLSVDGTNWQSGWHWAHWWIGSNVNKKRAVRWPWTAWLRTHQIYRWVRRCESPFKFCTVIKTVSYTFICPQWEMEGSVSQMEDHMMPFMLEQLQPLFLSL